MKVLLDTCILAELRHPKGNIAVKSAVNQIPDEDLFLSVLTIGEISKGVSLLAAGPKKKSLETWLTGLEAVFADRIVPIDLQTTHIWGSLMARGQKAGTTIPAIDGLLAATALQQGMHIMTRNTRHFEISGVLLIDPFRSQNK